MPSSTLRKPAQSESSLDYHFTPIPTGLAQQLLGALSPACVCLCFIVLDRTIGMLPGKGKARPEWCTTTEAELAEILRISDRGVRNLLQEATDNQTAILKVRHVTYGIELHFAMEAVSKLGRLRELQRRLKRKSVRAMPAKLECPVGQKCPVTEVYVNGGLVSNIAAADVPGSTPQVLDNTQALPPSPFLHPGTVVPPSPFLHPGTVVPPSPFLHPGTVVPPSPFLHPGTVVPPSQTQVVDSTHEQVVRLLEEIVMPVLRKAPPEHIVADTVKGLDQGTVEDLHAALLGALSGGRLKSYGLIPLLARDCGVAAAKLAKQGPNVTTLFDQLCAAEGSDAQMRIANKILAHPHCSNHDREGLYRVYPGLRFAGQEMFADAHQS